MYFALPFSHMNGLSERQPFPCHPSFRIVAHSSPPPGSRPYQSKYIAGVPSSQTHPFFRQYGLLHLS